MIIGGLQKTTLIDFPGKISCTVFLVGCNFRCPFCHNKDLVTNDLFKKSQLKPISQKEFFNFLEKRKKILEGVCITGGEPTINKDLPEFIKKIKKLGYEVKLDTNGSNPEMINKLIKRKLIDYIAMDVKGPLDEYDNFIKLKAKAQNPKLIKTIEKSIKLILNSGINFEFRTTVVPGLHNKNNMVKLAKQLKESMVNGQWYLQPFRPQNCLNPAYLKKQPFSEKELKEKLKAVKKIIPNVYLRGN